MDSKKGHHQTPPLPRQNKVKHGFQGGILGPPREPDLGRHSGIPHRLPRPPTPFGTLSPREYKEKVNMGRAGPPRAHPDAGPEPGWHGR